MRVLSFAVVAATLTCSAATASDIATAGPSSPDPALRRILYESVVEGSQAL